MTTDPRHALDLAPLGVEYELERPSPGHRHGSAPCGWCGVDGDVTCDAACPAPAGYVRQPHPCPADGCLVGHGEDRAEPLTGARKTERCNYLCGPHLSRCTRLRTPIGGGHRLPCRCERCPEPMRCGAPVDGVPGGCWLEMPCPGHPAPPDEPRKQHSQTFAVGGVDEVAPVIVAVDLATDCDADHSGMAAKPDAFDWNNRAHRLAREATWLDANPGSPEAERCVCGEQWCRHGVSHETGRLACAKLDCPCESFTPAPPHPTLFDPLRGPGRCAVCGYDLRTDKHADGLHCTAHGEVARLRAEKARIA